MPTYSHSIILQPGEQFTLPPGGELFYVNSTEDITSTCPVETVDAVCYQFDMPSIPGAVIFAMYSLIYGGQEYKFTHIDGNPSHILPTKAADAGVSLAIEQSISQLSIVIKINDYGVVQCQVGNTSSEGASAVVIRLPKSKDPIYMKIIDGNTSSISSGFSSFLAVGTQRDDCNCPYD